MAEPYLALSGYCIAYNALLDRNCMASRRYCEALSELMFLAGRQDSSRFADAKRNCNTCLADCRITAEKMHSHKAAHGC